MTLHRSIAAAPPADFDFEIGSWQVHHRRLDERLAGCTTWTEFDGTAVTTKILGGFGNLEDNFLELPGDPYRAVALRSYDPAAGLWSIWWLDGRNPTQVDVPVVGRFENGVGTFLAEDTLRGMPISIRFTWSVPSPDHPRWEQAFSADGGKTWETNWVMEFRRTE